MTEIYAFDLSLRSAGHARLGGGLLSLRTRKTTAKEADLQDAVRIQATAATQAFRMGKPDVVLMESGALGAIRGKGYEELGALRWLLKDHVRHVYKMDVIEISPSHLKKVVTGNGRADKREVMARVTELGALKYWPAPANDDEADAAGLIITYLMDNGLWRVNGQLRTEGTGDGDHGDARTRAPF